MKIKTLHVDGKRTHGIYEGGIVGHNYLYPEGTKRIVINSFFILHVLIA